MDTSHTSLSAEVNSVLSVYMDIYTFSGSGSSPESLCYLSTLTTDEWCPELFKYI